MRISESSTTNSPCKSRRLTSLAQTLTHSSAHQLRERGWVVPAYTMAPHSEQMKMLRVVVREDFTKSRCDALIADFKLALQTLDSLDAKKLQEHKE
jgi:glutamate/tyrosine decarboxylase-like PLP-dependent enzyme